MRSACSLAIAVLLCGCSSSPKHAEEQRDPGERRNTRSISCEFRNNSGDISSWRSSAKWAPKGAARFHKLVHDRFLRWSAVLQSPTEVCGPVGYQRRIRKRTSSGSSSKLRTIRLSRAISAGSSVSPPTAPIRELRKCLSILSTTNVWMPAGSRRSARVTEGMDVVDKLYSGYGEVQGLRGQGVDAVQYQSQGEGYIQRHFPKLDQIKSARIVQ